MRAFLRSKWPVIVLLLLLSAVPARADVMDDLEAAYKAQREGRHKQAIQLLTRVIKTGGLKANERAVAYLLRGEAYMDARQYKRAVADFTRALKIQPEYAHALYLRGVSFEKQGMYKDALADVEKAVMLKPEKEAYRNRLEIIKAKLTAHPQEQSVTPE